MARAEGEESHSHAHLDYPHDRAETEVVKRIGEVVDQHRRDHGGENARETYQGQGIRLAFATQGQGEAGETEDCRDRREIAEQSAGADA